MAVDPVRLIEDYGFSVFPVGGEKRPLVRGGFNSATRSVERVAKWTAELGSKIAGWGIPTGIENGFIAIDIDTPEAEDWWDSQWLPDGKEVRTPSGGKHVYYAVSAEAGIDVQTNRARVAPGVDVRGEGGYVVAYTDDWADIPDLPASVAELLPERQYYSIEPIPEYDAPTTERTPQEDRVIEGFLSKLDALPRPWRKGAGYHDTQFRVACGLARAARSPYFSITFEEARAEFLRRAPIRDDAHAHLPSERWESAVKTTEGQWLKEEELGDVPIRIPAIEVLDKYPGSQVERLFWESKKIGDVKELIRELRHAGATEQEAYSASYDSRAMKEIRKKNPNNSGTTWGYVKAEYSQEIVPFVSREVETSTVPKFTLLTDAERTEIRDLPNFIDEYILVAKEMFAEPNLPLNYVNAWIALSSILGDRGSVFLEGKRIPLNLWAILSADSAAGKGDAKNVLKQVIASALGSFGKVSVGHDASAQGMNEVLIERDGRVSLFFEDEASRLIEAMHDAKSYEKKFRDAALDWYDGETTTAVRVGMDSKDIGKDVRVVFNMWLQTTWDNVVTHMDLNDVSSGFVGRFLFAIGDDAKITTESLTPKFAGEYQIELDGVHPEAMSLGMDVAKARRAFPRHARMHFADDGVTARYVESRKAMLAIIEGHTHEKALKGIVLRLSENAMKGAALLALSDGREEIAMTDLLIALKSAGYWLRDVMRVIDAISSSDYRKRVESLVRFVAVKPRTRAEILREMKNLKTFEAIEVMERAEAEGSIVLRNDRWELNQ